MIDTLTDIVSTFSPLKTVIADLGTFEPSHHDRPVAGVIPNEDTPSRRASDVSQHTMDFAVRLIVDDGVEHSGWDLIEVAADIEEYLLKDRTRGGLAEDTRFEGKRTLYLDRDFPQAGADLLYVIDYKRKVGAPREAI